MNTQNWIRSRELMDKTGATYRQIDYWCRKAIIEPVGEYTPGSGVYRMFDEEIVEKVKLLVTASNAFGGFPPHGMLHRIYMCYEDGGIDLDGGIRLSWIKAMK